MGRDGQITKVTYSKLNSDHYVWCRVILKGTKLCSGKFGGGEGNGMM